jgi:hypothetical protein
LKLNLKVLLVTSNETYFTDERVYGRRLTESTDLNGFVIRTGSKRIGRDPHNFLDPLGVKLEHLADGFTDRVPHRSLLSTKIFIFDSIKFGLVQSIT